MIPDENDRRNEAHEAMNGPGESKGWLQAVIGGAHEHNRLDPLDDGAPDSDDTDPDFWRGDVEEGPVST